MTTDAATVTSPLDLFHLHLPLAREAATKMAARLPAHVDRDDLEQVALIALWKVAQRYEPERGLKFKTYAVPRLRGAVLDHLRDCDHLGRKHRKDGGPELKQFGRGAMHSLSSGYDFDGNIWRYDEERAIESRPEPPPDFVTSDAFRRHTRGLGQRERMVFWRYYAEGKTMRAIGGEIGVAESRVCQIIAQGLEVMRDYVTPEDA